MKWLLARLVQWLRSLAGPPCGVVLGGLRSGVWRCRLRRGHAGPHEFAPEDLEG